MNQAGKLQNQVAIVTAAGRGIGQGIAHCLAEQGARLVVNSYSPDKLAETVRSIESLGCPVASLAGDITQPETMLELRDLALSEFGQIDILVNNVGAGPKSAIEPPAGELGSSMAMWDAMYAQNLRPVVLMTEAVIPHMKRRGQGKVIVISSIAGKASLSDQMLTYFVPPAYGAMKAALANYAQTQAELLGPYNINVNAVCPGIVYTDAWRGNAQRAVNTLPRFKGQDPQQWFDGIARGDYPDMFERTPLRRAQTVQDIGRAVVFMVSPDAANITGQSLMVDGGMVKL